MNSGLYRVGTTGRRNCAGPDRCPFPRMIRSAVPAGGPGRICRSSVAVAGLYAAGSHEPAAFAAARPMHG